MLEFNCPGCGGGNRFPDRFAGRRLRCDTCDYVYVLTVARIVEKPPDVIPVTVPRHGPYRAWSLRPRGDGVTILALFLGGGFLTMILLCAGLLWLLFQFGPHSGAVVQAQPGPAGPASTEPPSDEPVDLPPLPPQEPIEPPGFAGDTQSVGAGGGIADLAVGGGGRYVVVWLREQRKLAILDVRKAAFVKIIPVAEDVKFAAGMNRLIVVLPKARTVQCWSFADFAMESERPLPLNGTIHSICMGAASNGPLLVHGEGGDFPAQRRLQFIDIRTMTRMNFRGKDWDQPAVEPTRDSEFRAADDGLTFGVWDTRGSPEGLGCITVRGGRFRSIYQQDSAGWIVPMPDGRLLATGCGVLTDQLERFRPSREGLAGFPGHQAPYHLGFPDLAPGFVYGNAAFDSAPSLYLPEDRFSFGNLQPVRLGTPQGRSWRDDPLSFDKRFQFVPGAQVLVTIPGANDRVVLERIEIEKVLHTFGRNYLVITSMPPRTASRGEVYRYSPTALSRKGGVTWHLKSGPPGMTISPTGTLTWEVSKEARGSWEVELAVSDASGQERGQSFTIQVGK
jgi:hypothetical protein